MTKVAILGASGMLGSMLTEFFSGQRDVDVVATARDGAETASLQRQYPRVDFKYLDAETCTVQEIIAATAGAAWIINAIGLIKQRIVDSDDSIAERAIRVNAIFPYLLAQAASAGDFKVIQIATDCVYSGMAGGRYTEASAHDCHDVYGKTKSLGEVHAPNVCNLRCSIVGPERKSSLSLLNWFLSSRPGTRINGFTNHFWNGITALHFAKICKGIISHNLPVRNSQHVVPQDEITKEGLLRLFANAFGRDGVAIEPVQAAVAINRTLQTVTPASNAALWKAAGYAQPPSIAEMIHELADHLIMRAVVQRRVSL